MDNKSRVFFKSLEALRGLAAVVVIIYHVGWNNPFYDIEFIRNGALMVDLFFVLSGFVMVHCYGQYFKNKNNITDFLRSRFWRLYPLHFIMLFIFLFIEIAKYIAEVKFSVVAGAPAFLHSNSETFASNIFLLHSLLEDHGSFNSPSWSISAEFYTYIFFAFLMLAIKKIEKTHIIFFIISCTSLLIILNLGHKSLTFDYNGSIFRCIYGFFLGAFTYEIYLKLSNLHLFSINKYIKMFLIICLILSFLFVLLIKHDNYIEFLMPPLTSILILLLTLNPKSIINKVLCWRVFLWLGKVSYSIYMVHMLFIWFFSAFLQVFLKVPKKMSESGDLIIFTSVQEGMFFILVFLICVFVTSHFSHKYIEVRFRKLAQKI